MTNHFTRVGLAHELRASRRRRPSRKTSPRDRRRPEEMDGTALADEAAPGRGQHVRDGAGDARIDRWPPIVSVQRLVAVETNGNGTSTATGQILTGKEAAPQQRHQMPHRKGHCLRPQRQRADVTAGGANNQPMIDEIELMVNDRSSYGSGSVDSPGRQLKRDAPTVADRSTRAPAQSCHNPRPHVQRGVGVLPSSQRQLGPGIRRTPP